MLNRGPAIETMIWSMKVTATAKIIPVRIRPFDRPPALAALLRLIVLLLYRDEAACAQTRTLAALGSGCHEATCPCRFSPDWWLLPLDLHAGKGALASVSAQHDYPVAGEPAVRRGSRGGAGWE
jgi:hypothetical protein